MSSLRTKNHTINTFDEKIEILKNVVFFSSSFADLKNIANFSYSVSKECFMIITEIEIKQTINLFKVDKTVTTSSRI